MGTSVTRVVNGSVLRAKTANTPSLPPFTVNPNEPYSPEGKVMFYNIDQEGIK
jgi:hypothetical protein